MISLINHKKSINLFVACATGGGIGSLIALNSGIFWPVGLVVGCLLGYLVYDWGDFWRAIKKSYREVNLLDFLSNNFLTTLIRASIPFLWRLLYKYLQSQWYGGLILGFIVLVVCTDDLYDVQKLPGTIMVFLLYFQVFAGFSAICLAAKESVRCRDSFKIEYEKPHGFGKWFEFTYEVSDKSCNYFNRDMLIGSGLCFFSGLIFSAILIIFGPIMLLVLIITLLIKTPGVIIKAVTLVHSDVRLLCLCDAGIGTLIGFMSGSPIVGALVGGIFGAVNYEVVSKRLLKLPQKNI